MCTSTTHNIIFYRNTLTCTLSGPVKELGNFEAEFGQPGKIYKVVKSISMYDDIGSRLLLITYYYVHRGALQHTVCPVYNVNLQKYLNEYTVQIWVREAFLHTKLKAMIFAP